MAKTINYTADVAISGDATIGGNTVMQGKTTVKKNLKVEGWLEAPNIRGASKGLFTTLEKLQEYYPEPATGWFAYVGTTLPADIYCAWDGDWHATGEQGGSETLALDELEELITSEESARTSSDEALQTNIDNEATSRETADTTLQTNITALKNSNAAIGTATIDALDDIKASETSHSVYNIYDSDSKYLIGVMLLFRDPSSHVYSQVIYTHNILTDEGTISPTNHSDGQVYCYYRVYNISTSSDNTGAEKGSWSVWKDYILNHTELVNYLNSLQTSLEKETTARTTADTTLQTNIDTETTARTSADEALQTSIDTEATAREEADSILRKRITVRFNGIATLATITDGSAASTIEGIYYVTSEKRFAAKVGSIYYANWAPLDGSYLSADYYMNSDRTELLKDKLYIYGGSIYVWDEDTESLSAVNS